MQVLIVYSDLLLVAISEKLLHIVKMRDSIMVK